MGISGNLKTMELAELLQWLFQGQKTGTLVIEGGRYEKRIFFEKGLIISSASTDPKEYLGRFMVNYGLVTEEQLDESLAAQKESQNLLGQVMVDRGLIDEKQLAELLQFKVEETIYDVFSWDEGDFRFLDRELPDQEMLRLNLDVQWIILEGSRRVDEWLRIREVVPSPLTVPVVVCDLEAVEYEEEIERHILAYVDDDSSVEEISQSSATTLFMVSKAIADHTRLGHLKAIRPRIIEVPVAGEKENKEEPAPAQAPAPAPAQPAAPNSGQVPLQPQPAAHPQAPAMAQPNPSSGMMHPQHSAHYVIPGHQGHPYPQAAPPGAYPSGFAPGMDAAGQTLHYAPQPGSQAPPYPGPPPGAPPGSPVSAVHPVMGNGANTEAERLLNEGDMRLAEQDLEAALRNYREAAQAADITPALKRKVQLGEDRVRQALEREGLHPKAVPRLQCAIDALGELDISPQEGFMLTRVDGTYDIKSILQMSPMPKLDTLILFWRLKRLGHVSI